jgi:hypothetical protein
MAPRKTAPVKKAAAKRSAPRKRPAASKNVTKSPPARPRKAPAKRAAKPPADPAPTAEVVHEIGVLKAVEAFIASSEITGQARVKAEIARKLATALDSADPPTAPALARELQTALIGILPRDAEEHDDWTTRLGAAEDRNAKGS